jgi:hypothetical protein
MEKLTRREYAYLCITGPGQHERITEILGIKPTEAWNAGEISPRTGRPYRGMHWAWSDNTIDDTHPMREHIDSILLWFGTVSDRLRQLWVDYDLVIQCVGHYPQSCGPGIHFDREVIRRAAQLGLAIDCDFYFEDDVHHGHD